MVQHTPVAEIGQKRSSPRIEAYKAFWRRLSKNKAALVGGILILLFILTGLLGPLFTSLDPNATQISNKLKPPSAEHWFGTDNYGRDIFTRIIHGMSLTMKVGFFSVALGGAVGVFLGIISGYYGGKLDTFIMRIMDVLLAFPGILLALAIVSVLGGSLQNVIIAVGDLLRSGIRADCARFHIIG